MPAAPMARKLAEPPPIADPKPELDANAMVVDKKPVKYRFDGTRYSRQ